MTKRRLSKNQARRIKQQQHASIHRVRQQALQYDEDALGPEQAGRVVAHFGKQLAIEYAPGKLVRCFMRANLDTVVTGDKVVWRAFGDGGVVVSSQDRQSLLCRPDSYGKLKPVAANVDQIIVVVAPVPEFFTNLIDRYLVAAEIHGITPVILINKSDLINRDNRDKFDELARLYQGLGYGLQIISAKKAMGMDELKSLLADKTSIFVGQSGVGKSSIIQRLLPHEEIQVGRLSDAKTKGRHTTTHTQLFHFSAGGECIDSPGIREFGLWHLDKSQVVKGFVELSELATQCRFRDCSHGDEPGCAIKKALAEGRISARRLRSYQGIVASLDDVDVKTLGRFE